MKRNKYSLFVIRYSTINDQTESNLYRAPLDPIEISTNRLVKISFGNSGDLEHECFAV